MCGVPAEGWVVMQVGWQEQSDRKGRDQASSMEGVYLEWRHVRDPMYQGLGKELAVVEWASVEEVVDELQQRP